MKNIRYDMIANLNEWQALGNEREKVFCLHQQLRPHLQEYTEYVELIDNILLDKGYLLLVYHLEKGLIALAMYRMHHNTYQQKLFFLEDLIVADNQRSGGIGALLLTHLETIAKNNDCHFISLDSGTFRTRAHKFYYVHDYVADCFHFSKKLV